MPPRRQKNWPPAAVLSLDSQTNLTAVVRTDGTRAGYVGNNRRTAVLSQIASYTQHWGDGTQQSGVGPPPLELSHSYPSGTGIVTMHLTVVDVTSLSATASISVTFTETTPPPTPTPPTAPSNLTATALSQSQIALSWTDNSSDEAAFQIERSVNGSVFQAFTNVAAGVTSFIDTTGLPSTTYAYRVRATNSAGTSASSNEATATTFDPPPVPTVPPTITLTPSATSVILTNPVTLTITATPGSQPLASWQLDWNDGVNIENGTGVPPATRTLTYAALGTYHPRLTVTPTSGPPVSTSTTISVIAASVTGVATLAFTSIGWATVSLWLPQGQVPAEFSLRVGSYASQTNVKRTWSDGSAKHVLVTANILVATTHVVTVVMGMPSSVANPGGNPAIRGPQVNPTFPAGTVTIAAGASIQAAINANPAGTTFRLSAGTYSGTVVRNIVPKSGNTFIGEYGAILDGTGWVTSDLDDAAFKALNVDVDNVTIRNLTIRNMPQKGIMAYRDFSSGWTVDQCEIDHCKNGVELPGNSALLNSKIHDNVGTPGHINPAERGGGYSFNTVSGTVMRNNEIYANGTEQKWILCSNITCADNFFHHSTYAGPWIDGGGPGSIIEDNICDDNTGPGIVDEIAFGVIIRRNACNRNGEGGILISASSSTQVYENTLSNNAFGIDTFLDCSRLSEHYPPFPDPDLANNDIHHNIVVVGAGQFASIFTYVGACQAPYVANTKNNRFHHNTYVLPGGGNFFIWGNGNNLTLAGWQAVPQDAILGTAFAAAWPSGSVVFTISGTPWTATLPPFTGNSPWLSGDLAYESRATVIPMNGSTPHPLLRVWFDVRSFLGGGHVVDVAVNNILDKSDGDSVTYNVTINVAGSGVFTQNGVVHSYLKRWRKRFTTGLTEAAWTPDFTSLFASQVLPQYSTSVAAAGALLPGGLPASSASAAEIANDFSAAQYGILQFGDMTAQMNASGWRPELSEPYPDWIARALVHKSLGSIAAVKKMADLAGSWSGNITNEDGSLITLTQYPDYWIDPAGRSGAWPLGPKAVIPNVQIRGIGEFIESAHLPHIISAAYVLTGDRYYYDQLRLWASVSIMQTYPGEPTWYGARGTSGIVLTGEVRGFARILKQVIDAAACAPDTDPQNAYFASVVQANIAWVDTDCGFTTGGPFSVPSYWITKGNPPGEFLPGWQHSIPWQDAYVAWVARAAQRAGVVTGTTGNAIITRIGRMWHTFWNRSDWPLGHKAPYRLLCIPEAPMPPLNAPYTGTRKFSESFTDILTAMNTWAPSAPPPATGSSGGIVGYYDGEAWTSLLLGALQGIDTSGDLSALLSISGVTADLGNRAGYFIINP